MNRRMHLRTSRLQALSITESTAASLYSSTIASPTDSSKLQSFSAYMTLNHANCSYDDDDFQSLLNSLNAQVVPVSPQNSTRNRSSSFKTPVLQPLSQSTTLSQLSPSSSRCNYKAVDSNQIKVRPQPPITEKPKFYRFLSDAKNLKLNSPRSCIRSKSLLLSENGVERKPERESEPSQGHLQVRTKRPVSLNIFLDRRDLSLESDQDKKSSRYSSRERVNSDYKAVVANGTQTMERIELTSLKGAEFFSSERKIARVVSRNNILTPGASKDSVFDHLRSLLKEGMKQTLTPSPSKLRLKKN